MMSFIVMLYGATAFLGAALLLSVQPLIGKMVLPALGGTPAVWTTCLMFFQATVLGGYLLAHGVGHGPKAERHRVALPYLLLLASLFTVGYIVQPITLQSDLPLAASADTDLALGLLGFLFHTATVPLVACSATAPLLQAWFALTAHPRARDPYFLYAASNAGSLCALLAYPVVIEPSLGLRTQSQLWRMAFLILLILVLACGAIARFSSRVCSVGSQTLADCSKADRPRGGTDDGSGVPLRAGTLFWWLVLLFITSSWLMSVTTYLTTDLAPIPLLWTIPLALYFLSFVVAFALLGTRIVRWAARVFPYVVVPLVLVMCAGFVQIVWLPLHLLVFFIGCVACHGTLARLRPAAKYASIFYMTIAAGGLLGGIFNTLVAPLVFTRIVEYPMAVALACAVAPGISIDLRTCDIRHWLSGMLLPMIVFVLTAIVVTNRWGLATSVLGPMAVMVASGVGLLTCVTAHDQPVRFALTVTAVFAASSLTQGPSGRLLHAQRNFFGVVRVTYDTGRNAHRFFHGSTLHGQQSLNPMLRAEPSAFFTRTGPIGRIFGTFESRHIGADSHIAIIGLGVGTLASYARPTQHWTFYEIDSAVSQIAQTPTYFTYLRDSQAKSIEVVLGDARLQLQHAPAHYFQLIVLDAFSSDAVPLHLLSREAIQLYRDKLADGGLLVFNLSNRYLDLDPVIGGQASDAGMVCRVCYDLHVSDEEDRLGKQPSIWAVMATTERDLGELTADLCWQAPVARLQASVWTDDYSDLADYLLVTPGRLWSRKQKRDLDDYDTATKTSK